LNLQNSGAARVLAAPLFSTDLDVDLYVEVTKVVDKTGQTPKITVLPFSISFFVNCLARIGGQGYDHPEL